jgi:hypothetical protein
MTCDQYLIEPHVFAEFNRAQLACITPHMRAIGFRQSETDFTVTFFFSKAASKGDEEAALDIMDTLEEGGEMPKELRLRHRFVHSDGPLDALDALDGLSFLRKEDA